MVSILASCTHSAAEAWLAAWADPRLQSGEGGGERLGWLASVNANTCGVETDELCRKFMVVMLTISFFSGWKLLGSFSEQVTREL